MGIGVPNAGAFKHSSGGAFAGYRAWAHQTSLGVDTMSGDCSAALMRDVWDAVGSKASDAVLDAAGYAAWGSWYTTFIAGNDFRADLRNSVDGLKRP